MNNIFFCSFMFMAKEKFRAYIKDFDAKEVLFIPTASHKEPHTDYCYRAYSYFEELGFKVRSLEVDRVDREKCLEKLERADILYVAGGNTFYLLQELQKKELLDPIREKVAAGMVYVGESAGSVVATKDIEYVHLIDPKEEAKDLVDTKGLGLVDFSILPHFGEEPFADVNYKTEAAYKGEIDFVKINNSEVVIVDNNGKANIK